MADSGARPECPKRFRTKEQIKHERDSDRARAKTRVNLGDAFNSWRELRRSKGLKSDPELALFLLNGAGAALSTPSEGAHQKVIDVDETMPEETPSEHEEEDTSEFPDLMAVQDEDDLTEKSACIAYEECLRKLGSFLQLPIQTCPHVDPITKTKCGCCSPFHVGISRRGTAFIMEWFCSNGHSVWKWNSQPLLKYGMQSGDLMLSSSILLSGSSYTKVGLLFKHMNMGMVVDTTLHSIQDSSMKDYWQRKRAEVLARLKERNSETAHEFHGDVQQLQIKEEPSWQQDWSCSLDQQDMKPQHIKKGQDEFLETAKNEEQPQGLTEDDTNTLPLNVVAVKIEDDEERLHLRRQTEPLETGDNKEDCGGPEPDRISHPESSSTPEIEVMIEDSSETETADSDDCQWTREKRSGSNADELYSCSECNESFNRQESLIRHKMDHTGVKPFSCSDCGKRFTTRHYLIRHRVLHTEGKPFSCSDCGKSFTLKINLKRHRVIHTREKHFSCSDCKKVFLQKNHLRRHMANHREEKPFSCSECSLTFNTKSDLMAHMPQHSKLKPFSCSVCNKSYSYKPRLVRHMKFHTEEKPFTCSECGKKFEHKHSLNIHMRNHTDRKLLSCSGCDKQFKYKCLLIRHSRTHTGERPFSCSVCHSTFKRRAHVSSHMLLHTGEKPYSCSDCGRSFNQKSVLTSHMRTHTGERPFSCSVCQQKFRQRGHLKTHMQTHKKEKQVGRPRSNQGLNNEWYQFLTSHVRVLSQGKEKPNGCSVISKDS